MPYAWKQNLNMRFSAATMKVGERCASDLMLKVQRFLNSERF